MSYVRTVLQPGEDITYDTGLHWIGYVPGLATGLVGCLFLIWAGLAKSADGGSFLHVCAGFLGIVAICMIAWHWFRSWIIEVAATTRRVIYKKGFIRRDTKEMNLDKVESVLVKQTILGRLLDYGDITITGTGDTRFERIKGIAHPIRLRNQIMGN